MMSIYRTIRESCRMFYMDHKDGIDLLGDFLGALSIFAFLYVMYILLWMLGIGC